MPDDHVPALGTLPARLQEMQDTSRNQARVEIDLTECKDLTGENVVDLLIRLDLEPNFRSRMIAIIGLPGDIELSLANIELNSTLHLQFQELPVLLDLQALRCRGLELAVNSKGAAPAVHPPCEVILRNARVEGSVTFKGLATRSSLHLQGMIVEGSLNVLGCQIGRMLADPTVDYALSGDRMRIGQRLNIRHSRFNGKVLFRDATVGSMLNFQYVTITNPTSVAFCADGIKVMSDALIRHSTVHGQFVMVNARIDGEADFSQSRFWLPRRVRGQHIDTHPDSDGEAMTLYRLSVGGNLRLGFLGSARKRTLAIGCISLYGANIGQDLFVENASMINPRWQAEPISLVLIGAVIGRDLYLTSLCLKATVSMVGATVRSSLRIACTQIRAEKKAIFGVRARIGGDLRIIGHQPGDTPQEPCIIAGAVDFSGAEIGAIVDFSFIVVVGTQVNGSVMALVMEDARVGRRLCLGHDDSGGLAADRRDVPVETAFVGTVSLVGIHVRGDLYITGTQFCLPAPASSHSLDLKPGGQYSIGRINGGWMIDHNLQPEAEPGQISIDLTRAVIAGALIWLLPRELQGPTDAEARRTPAILEHRRMWSHVKPLLVSTVQHVFPHVGRPVATYPAGSAVSKLPLMSRLVSTLAQGTQAAATQSDREAIKFLVPPGEVHFSQSHVGRLWDSKACWPGKGKLVIDGFVFDSIDYRTQDIDIMDRGRWLSLQERNSQRFSLQPYEQVIKVYREYGAEEPSRYMAMLKQEALRHGWDKLPRAALGKRSLFLLPFRRSSAGVSWLFKTFLKVFAGYGYRPLRTVVALLVLLTVSTTLFAYNSDAFFPVLHLQYPLEFVVESTRPPPSPGMAASGTLNPEPLTGKGNDWERRRLAYGSFNPLLYAFDLALPAIEIGHSKYWELRDDVPQVPFAGLLSWWIPFHIIVGHILFVVLAISPTALLRKD